MAKPGLPTRLNGALTSSLEALRTAVSTTVALVMTLVGALGFAVVCLALLAGAIWVLVKIGGAMAGLHGESFP